MQQTVQTFHTALQTAEPLGLMTYSMIVGLDGDPQYATEPPFQQMTAIKIKCRCQGMKLRINARCKDLSKVMRKGSHKTESCKVVEIGFFAAMTPNVRILSKGHNIPQRISTSGHPVQ